MFSDAYPSYAGSSLPAIWSNYLNYNNGSGNWNYYSTTEWIALLKCCNIIYPVQDTLTNYCDSLNELVSYFNSTPKHSSAEFVNLMTGTFNSTNYSLGYWLGQTDSCGISCPNIIRCSRADSVINQFTSTYPQYATNCLPQIFADYLNSNNASGYSNGYNYSDWIALLNCCHLTYPGPDTLNSYCDSLYEYADFFHSTSNYSDGKLSHFTSSLTDAFGYMHYDYSLDRWVYHDFSYWLTQLDSCNIPCSLVIRCGYVDTLMQTFNSANPSYSDTSPIFIWVNYLNSHNTIYNFTQTEWIQILNCCNIPYPIPDTLNSYCDSLAALVSVYNSSNAESGYSILVNQLNAVFGTNHWDSGLGKFVNHTWEYWQTRFDSCGIPCPHVINCSLADSIMSQFLLAYPQFTDSCPAFIWVNYLNTQNAGNGQSYTAKEWISLLKCCNISYPTLDSTNSLCDSVAYAVDYFNHLSGSHSVWDFQYTMGTTIGWGYNDAYGHWVAYDYSHWFALIDSCHLPCPQIVSCSYADSIMQLFLRNILICEIQLQHQLG